MIVRRLLLVAGAFVLLWAAPASASHTYDHVLGNVLERPPAVVPSGGPSGGGVSAATTGLAADAGTGNGQADAGAGSNTGLLARTGSRSAVVLAEAGTVLLAGGALLVVAARRRRSQPSPVAT